MGLCRTRQKGNIYNPTIGNPNIIPHEVKQNIIRYKNLFLSILIESTTNDIPSIVYYSSHHSQLFLICSYLILKF